MGELDFFFFLFFARRPRRNPEATESGRRQKGGCAYQTLSHAVNFCYQFLLSGDLTALRFLFVFSKVGERYGDEAPFQKAFFVRRILKRHVQPGGCTARRLCNGRSFRAQRLHGLDFRGAGSRSPHGEQGNCGKGACRRQKHRRVPRLNTEEE